MTWTREQIKAEKEYIIDERLGIFCGYSDPTPEQMAIAKAQADAWEKSIPAEDKI